VTFWRRVFGWFEHSETLLARWLRAAHDALLGEMPILAAGTALFAIFAVVPLLAAVVAIYGVVADPHDINSHLKGLETVLPTNVVAFLSDQLTRQAQRSHRALGLALGVSIVVALYSARSAARALMDALNRAYRVRERRGSLQKLLITVAIAGGTLIGLILMVAAVVALPGILALLRLDAYSFAQWLRWPALMGILFAALNFLYRYGPSPRPLGTERHLWPGALVGTLLLVAVSWGLSQWVDRVRDYDLVYGAFGSAIVVLLWFYLSTIALVVGGFVNAELERHAGAPQPDRSLY